MRHLSLVYIYIYVRSELSKHAVSSPMSTQFRENRFEQHVVIVDELGVRMSMAKSVNKASNLSNTTLTLVKSNTSNQMDLY